VLRHLDFVSVFVIEVLAGCGGSDATKVDFRLDVLTERNQTDVGLAQIVNARSLDDLLERMRIAASEVRSAAHDLEEAGAPKELQDERDALAARLLALSDEIASTVTTLESFPEQAAATKALSFEQWNSVQAELKKLRAQGVDVRPLERHKPELQRQ
jgi:predicted  nucleic acid-binding Zn-ribbon protein